MAPACGPGPMCPVTRAVEVLGGKWKLHIVFHLMGGTKRFSALHRAIPGITQQMLTAQLRELERDGVVTRTVYPVVPPKVEYALSDFGARLRTVTSALEDWGRDLVPASAEGEAAALQSA